MLCETHKSGVALKMSTYAKIDNLERMYQLKNKNTYPTYGVYCDLKAPVF